MRNARLYDLALLLRFPEEEDRLHLGREDEDESSLLSELEDLGLLSEYGLSFDKGRHSEKGRYLAFVMSTGGPHEELRWYLDADLKPREATFVSKPWFGYVELMLTGSYDATAIRLFNHFTGDDPSHLLASAYEREEGE